MGLSTIPVISEQEVNTISSTQQGAVGARGYAVDGREFRYGLAGVANLAVGKLTQAPAVVANHGTVASPLSVQASAVVGATQVSVTLGATAASANQYAGGYLVITDGPGAGQSLLIRNHAAVLSAGVITLNLVDPVTTAITVTTSKCVLQLNQYSGLLISATTTIDKYCGVPNIAVTAAYYGWFQSKGTAAVLADASTWTTTVSFPVTGSALTAGAVGLVTLTGNAQSINETIGYVTNSIPVSAKYSNINLNIL